mmetsp:Transcript_17123/g.51251  ORF Transcript_17123/g.51251 Transcript_17123/m.51251 type:complete len:342 (+) Transcript_17123:220-1245(+)
MSMSGGTALSGLLSSTTRLSQAISAVLVSGYLLQFIPGFRAHVALVAGRTIPCVWNVFTAGLLEEHLYTLVASVLALLLMSRVIEPVYGSKAYLKFLGIVLSFSGLSAFVSVYIAYALDRNESSNLLFQEICGFHGVLAGLLVAVKHIAPDTELTLLQVAKLRAKHLAGLYIVAQAIMSLILGRVIATMPFVLGGAYSAWFYLRFLQPNASDPTQQGDSSADFSFASFYPAPVQPVVDRVAGVFAGIFKLDRPAAPAASGGAPAAQAPAAKSAEASRRRERGQRALEERLGLRSTVQVGQDAAAPLVKRPPADVETGAGGGNGSGGGDDVTSEIEAAPDLS